MKIYVGNLSRITTEEALRAAFEPFGDIISVRLITDRESGEPRGFAFVEMRDEEKAQEAISALNGSELEGNRLRVNEARPQEDRGPRRGGFNRGGSMGGGRSSSNGSRGGFGGGAGSGRSSFGGGRGGSSDRSSNRFNGGGWR